MCQEVHQGSYTHLSEDTHLPTMEHCRKFISMYECASEGKLDSMSEKLQTWNVKKRIEVNLAHLAQILGERPCQIVCIFLRLEFAQSHVRDDKWSWASEWLNEYGFLSPSPSTLPVRKIICAPPISITSDFKVFDPFAKTPNNKTPEFPLRL